jgi:hypothetical protein
MFTYCREWCFDLEVSPLMGNSQSIIDDNDCGNIGIKDGILYYNKLYINVAFLIILYSEGYLDEAGYPFSSDLSNDVKILEKYVEIANTNSYKLNTKFSYEFTIHG